MKRPRTIVDGETFALGVLGLSACVLFVGLMLLVRQPAQASGQSDKAGDYKMVTQQVSRTKELLLVVDAAAKAAIVYDFDFNNKKVEMAAQIPLDQLPKPGDVQVPEPARRRP